MKLEKEIKIKLFKTGMMPFHSSYLYLVALLCSIITAPPRGTPRTYGREVLLPLQHVIFFEANYYKIRSCGNSFSWLLNYSLCLELLHILNKAQLCIFYEYYMAHRQMKQMEFQSCNEVSFQI